MKVHKLKVGDIIVVSKVLSGISEYPVLEINGNRAITNFRVFNSQIYCEKYVYEYGKKDFSTTNSYWIKK